MDADEFAQRRRKLVGLDLGQHAAGPPVVDVGSFLPAVIARAQQAAMTPQQALRQGVALHWQATAFDQPFTE